MTDNLLTIPEVAARLRCPLKTAYLRAKAMPRVRQGKYLLVPEADLEAWIRSHTEPPCDSTSVENSGGSPGPATTAKARSKRRKKPPSAGPGDASLSEPIRLTQPRRRPPSAA